MGYYSKFTVDVKNNSPGGAGQAYAWAHRVRRDGGTPDDRYLADLILGKWRDSAKWYSYDEDLRHLSRMCPGADLHLRRVGEDDGDIEFVTYRGGKAHRRPGRLVADQFDPEKLS